MVIAIVVILLMLLARGRTLNLQSFMGMIKSTGIPESSTFLLVDQAERSRFVKGREVRVACFLAALPRLRHIIMTALAMNSLLFCCYRYQQCRRGTVKPRVHLKKRAG